MTRSLALVAIMGFLVVPGRAVATGSASVAISEVYGGGGNSSALYANDYVELRNLSSSPVSLSGWSVQYASATGTSWSVTALPAVTLPPGRSFLVQEASGGPNGAALPSPDATGTTAMAATAGKVALVASASALSGACPTGLVDLVGYGATASCFEGAAAASAPSNTLSAQRVGHGYTDTDDNAADFQTAAPGPQNSTVPTAVGLRSFTARRSGQAAVILRWRTATEAGLAGFEIYRGAARLTARPIPAAGLLSGSAYVVRVPRAGSAAAYRLVGVGLDGSRTRLCSVVLTRTG